MEIVVRTTWPILELSWDQQHNGPQLDMPARGVCYMVKFKALMGTRTGYYIRPDSLSLSVYNNC